MISACGFWGLYIRSRAPAKQRTRNDFSSSKARLLSARLRNAREAPGLMSTQLHDESQPLPLSRSS